MYVHHYLKQKAEEKLNEEEEGSQLGFLQKLYAYFFPYSVTSFYYNIGGYHFNLEEIKHGLLR
jgi:hypothetical protein